jgi:hypothetical protein
MVYYYLARRVVPGARHGVSVTAGALVIARDSKSGARAVPVRAPGIAIQSQLVVEYVRAAEDRTPNPRSLVLLIAVFHSASPSHWRQRHRESSYADKKVTHGPG